MRRAVALHRRLTAALADGYAGREIDPALFQEVVDAAHRAMGAYVSPEASNAVFVRDALVETLADLAGRTPARADWVAACWRLAGNVLRIVREHPVPPWVRQGYDEWVHAQFVSAAPRAGFGGRPGHLFTLKVLTGSPAGTKATRFYYDSTGPAIAHQLGFDRPPNPRSLSRSRRPIGRQFRHPAEFVSMRLEVLVEPQYCTRDGPGFKDTRVDDLDRDWNREQMSYRDRPPGRRDHCLAGDFTLPCHRCPFGLESCRAATHARDYERRPCPACGNARAWFDPAAVRQDVCVDCRTKAALTGAT